MAGMSKAPRTSKPQSNNHAPSAAPRDFRQEVTNKIIELLEKGVAPWQKPWDASRAGLMPFNQVTKKPYRGGNALHLMITALDRGYDDPRWMTYKQAADNKGQVRKGEKGTQIEFWEIKPGVTKSEAPVSAEEDGEETESGRPSQFIHRIYTVFNAQQIDGLPPLETKKPQLFEVIEAGERILQHSGACITHDQADRAFYSRARDAIHLPKREAFRDAGSYYGTALHELAHWTGHPSRLNRLTLNESYRFGDLNYAKEELRAELASVFLAAERGIPHDPASHASYVGNWIMALQNDKNEIFRAAHDASAATDYLLALEKGREVAEEAAVMPATPEPAPATHAARVQQARTLTLDFGRSFDRGPGR